MSKLSETSYDIEQLYIDGSSPSEISSILNLPIDIVYSWIEQNNLGTCEFVDVSGMSYDEVRRMDHAL